jgi:hypothetical protein
MVDTHDGGDASRLNSVILAEPRSWIPAVGEHPWSAEDAGCQPEYLYETYDQLEVIEIDTSRCKNQTLFQPLPQMMPAGSQISIVGFHFGLTGIERTQGHFAIAIGDQVIVNEGVDIPGSSGGFERRFEVTTLIPSDSPIYWHIHNHGANRWILVSMTATWSD